jgi:hypothetical protein
MWPWGHLAVGYLVYVFGWRRSWRAPDGASVLVLVVATQLPDLIDKPLSWTFGILSHGRSLGHSLLVVTALILCVFAVAKRTDTTPLGTAFAIGYLTHLLGDALYPLLNGEWDALSFLLWPILTMEAYETTPSILSHFLTLTPTPSVVFEIGLFLTALLVWHRQHHPGMVYLWEQVEATT